MVWSARALPAWEEEVSLGPFPAPAPNRPDVARERVLLQIEQELLERVGTAPRGTDEFSLWKEEVLRRRGPSLATPHSQAPFKRILTWLPRVRTVRNPAH